MITWILNWWGRMIFRLKHGESCHCASNWGEWQMVDLGREKIRFCQGCGWMETTNHPWRGLLRRSR